VRNIRNMLAQGRQQLRQAMASLQNNAGINGASGSKRQQTGHKRHDEEFADCLREYQELGPAFHADMSFKDFCTIKHPEWYEPQVSVDKKVKVPRKKANGAYGEETPSTDVEDSTSYLNSDAHDNEDVREQLDGQDDSACSSSSLSGSVEDPTLQYSGDTCEDSYVLALRHDEIRRLDDLPLGVDMASRKSCMEDDELPMMTVTHFPSSQTPMTAMTHEDISGISDTIEEPCVGIIHKGHMDPQIQEERHDLEPVDYIHTYQYEESESPLLESSIVRSGCGD
jgi:hypothetical protein